MMDMRSRWNSLQTREQRLLQVVAVLLGLIMLQSLIIEPFLSAKDELRLDLENRQHLLQVVNNAVQQKQQLGGVGGGQRKLDSRAMMQVARETASRQQISDALQTIQEQGRNGVMVKFNDVSFDAINTWLHELAQQHGIVVVAMEARDKGHTGLVDLDVELGQ